MIDLKARMSRTDGQHCLATGGDDMLELYHYNDSVCAQKVRVCLAEKGLDWIPHHVDLMKLENLAPDYLKLNPKGVVPTLVHDGRVVCESTDIIEYLDEQFPQPALRPEEPGALARMRTLIQLQDDTALIAVGLQTMQRYIKRHMERLSEEKLAAYAANHPMPERGAIHAHVGRGGDIPQAGLDQAAADLENAVGSLEAALVEGPWLAGDRYSLADVTWTPFVHRMTILDMSVFWEGGLRPRTEDWWERIKRRPSYAEAISKFPTFTSFTE
ncbi:MAG: glutathione S-transferase family protein [bacterium]|nr:glutathione S-transferase family protein [bacterium]MCP5065553.1 glutathione S-transferase family protein [bacterium]